MVMRYSWAVPATVSGMDVHIQRAGAGPLEQTFPGRGVTTVKPQARRPAISTKLQTGHVSRGVLAGWASGQPLGWFVLLWRKSRAKSRGNAVKPRDA
ncbi:hypothetical protein AZ09_04780 [Acetobacter aceti 1023]|nr:hypothetical protein AZ09_04780 [Acetobacter aceti 1023]